MKEQSLKLIYDAKNDFGELAPMKLPDPSDKVAPKLKRLAPRRPEQYPDQKSNKARTDD
ncbi:MAG: hypothetical protein OXG49_12870 [Chloroflexi bacterium]|nr:hypothetical protein [Chloroflexota bacterium]